jgi:two-component system, cell cycle response regulator
MDRTPHAVHDWETAQAAASISMTKPYDIALLGFSAFERSTFESFFRLAARRQPGYRLTEELVAPAMVIANADDPITLRTLLANRPSQPVLLIGASDGGSGWPREPRPIKLMNVLNAVDQVLSPVAPRTQTEFREVTQSRPVPLPPAPAMPTPAYRPGDTQNFVSPPATPDEVILLVDDEDTVLAFMQERLRRLGFQTERVKSGQQALGRMEGRGYRFIFLDASLEVEGMDAFQTCKAIKQRKHAEGKPPVVVLLSARIGAMDRMKGTMAGCDGWLTKPLEEQELLKVLAKHDTQVQRGFQATSLGKP